MFAISEEQAKQFASFLYDAVIESIKEKTKDIEEYEKKGVENDSNDLC